MSPRYRLTPNAQENVDTICAFIADDSVDAALRVWGSLEQAFEQLAERPEVGHRREDLTNRPVKFWSVFSYLIVYDPAMAKSANTRERLQKLEDAKSLTCPPTHHSLAETLSSSAGAQTEIGQVTFLRDISPGPRLARHRLVRFLVLLGMTLRL